MTKMQKRWTIQPHNPGPPKPMPLEERLARYRAEPGPARRKRLVHAVHKAFGRSLGLRGAAKHASMRKLAGMPLDDILDEDMLLVIRDPKWARKETTRKAAR